MKIDFENVTEIKGIKDGVTQSIDVDQIEHDGVCQYDMYIFTFEDGTETILNRKAMQKIVDKW